jgi:hypothetical protein
MGQKTSDARKMGPGRIGRQSVHYHSPVTPDGSPYPPAFFIHMFSQAPSLGKPKSGQGSTVVIVGTEEYSAQMLEELCESIRAELRRSKRTRIFGMQPGLNVVSSMDASYNVCKICDDLALIEEYERDHLLGMTGH